MALDPVRITETDEWRQLAEHQPMQGIEDRGADEGPIAAHGGVELFAGRAAGADGFFAHFDGGDSGLANDLAEELFLIGEVEVDGTLGNSGTTGDVLESGPGEPALTENLEGGLDDLLWPVLGLSAPLGRFLGGGDSARHS